MRVVAASSAAAVTVAPGIGRPDSSVAATRMFPVVVTCDGAGVAEMAISSQKKGRRSP